MFGKQGAKDPDIDITVTPVPGKQCPGRDLAVKF